MHGALFVNEDIKWCIELWLVVGSGSRDPAQSSTGVHRLYRIAPALPSYY